MTYAGDRLNLRQTTALFTAWTLYAALFVFTVSAAWSLVMPFNSPPTNHPALAFARDLRESRRHFWDFASTGGRLPFGFSWGCAQGFARARWPDAGINSPEHLCFRLGLHPIQSIIFHDPERYGLEPDDWRGVTRDMVADAIEAAANTRINP